MLHAEITMVEPFEDICCMCGSYDQVTAVYGLFYCKPCFKQRHHNSQKFRKICEDVGIGNLEKAY